MGKIIVTNELARLLKERRILLKISAKQVSEKIQIKAAHLSKIENGLIKTMDTEVFDALMKVLFKGCSEEDTVKKIYESLRYWYSKNEIEKQLWFLNFDTVKRRIPLSKQLVAYLNDLIDKHSISRQVLLTRMNSNEALSNSQKSNNNLEYNKWYLAEPQNSGKKIIRIQMSEEQFNSVLDGKIEKTSYISVFCIAFYINKIIKYKDKTKITSDEYNNLMEDTETKLSAYNFCTIQNRNDRLSQAASQEEIESILGHYGRENLEIVKSIINCFKYASDLDIKLTNQRLSEFLENLQWDIGFMLRIMSFNYKTNVDSFEKKKKLLILIEELIEKYQKSSKSQISNPLSDY